MSEDDVLFGYRLRVLDYASRTSLSEACRVFGIHRSPSYVWKRRVERHGLQILRPRERRRPGLPNQRLPFVEERIVAFAPGQPGYGPWRALPHERPPTPRPRACQRAARALAARQARSPASAHCALPA